MEQCLTHSKHLEMLAVFFFFFLVSATLTPVPDIAGTVNRLSWKPLQPQNSAFLTSFLLTPLLNCHVFPYQKSSCHRRHHEIIPQYYFTVFNPCGALACPDPPMNELPSDTYLFRCRNEGFPAIRTHPSLPGALGPNSTGS